MVVALTLEVGGKVARVDRSFNGGANKIPLGRDTPQPKTNNASNFKLRQPLASSYVKDRIE